ncbi:hypothetical protein AVEN_63486-1 [Araneus ventricosus]|uniref:guanylate cyclase n=1 Tax=Araneus ventricosus TaxID=182803 RepID=A0A4Y2CSY5_ARAVE|nr:hypothetical protein AVEN_63486-1 [Araneus ventricosus]
MVQAETSSSLSDQGQNYKIRLKNTIIHLPRTSEEKLLEKVGHAVANICLSWFRKGLRFLGNTVEDMWLSVENVRVASSEGDTSLRVEAIPDGPLQILHHPHKKYFAPAMVGIIRETAKNLQQVDVMVNLTSVGEDFLYQVTTVSSSKTKSTDTDRYIEKLSRSPDDLGLSISIMCKVFPFHIIVDRDMQIVQLGKGLLRIFKSKLNDGDRHFSSFFVIQSPKVAVTFEDISQLSNVSFVLVIKTSHRDKETLQTGFGYSLPWNIQNKGFYEADDEVLD